MAAAVLLGMGVVLCHDNAQIVLIWAGACLSTGFTVGFLFGIPRTPRGEKTSPDVNTNLGEISDWLTKILVGLGLTQIQKIPIKLRELAGYMAEGMGNTQSQRVFAAGLIVYFAVVGFIAGYLLTKLILAALLRKADAAPKTRPSDLLPTRGSLPDMPKPGSAPGIKDIKTARQRGSDKTGDADAVLATAFTLKAYTDLENHETSEVLNSRIAELQDFKAQFPLFRMLYITLGRLYRWTDRYDQAIEILTQFIDAKKKDGSDRDEDTAVALYNRACYYAQKILATPDNANELLSKAVADLKDATARKKDYAEAARTDSDFDPIREKPEFKAAIGQPA